MKTIWYSVARLLHPITIAVILVGVSGFLLGLIIAVERQEPSIAAPAVDVGAANRIARLETALAGREAELTDLQAQLIQLRAVTPSSAELVDAEKRIAGLEAANADGAAEVKALQDETTVLAGRLAEAIQTRDELQALNNRLQLDNENTRKQNENARLEGERARADQEQVIADLRGALKDSETLVGAPNEKARLDRETERARLEQTISDLRRDLDDAEAQAGAQNEQARADRETERAGFEQTISDLRRELEVAQASVRTQFPIGTVARYTTPPTPPPAPPAAQPESTTQEAADREPASAPPSAPAASEDQTQQSAAVAPTAGPITRGIAAYQAEDYRAAYDNWLPPALKGSSRAQFFVGALYFEGRGVPTDRVLSFLWLRAATKNNDTGAIKLLSRVRASMTDAELTEVEARIANGDDIPER